MIGLVLCADDYALHAGVDAAVVLLARQGRLTATSCLATSPRWAQAAAPLRELCGILDVGLHFNLTEGHGQPAPGLATVMLRAWSQRLKAGALMLQWQRQLDAFEQAMHRPPVFVDGHQHVHQFPGIRDAMLHTLRARYGAQAPRVRATVPCAGLRSAKELALAQLGGRHTRRLLDAAGLRCNAGFAGVYGFDANSRQAYGRHMLRWLDHAVDGAMLMCHPAQRPMAGDAIATQRVAEYRHLRSWQFLRQLRDRDIRLVRWSTQP